PGRLDVHEGAMDHALEARRGRRVGRALADEAFQLGVEILRQAAAELVDVDVARAHDGGGVAVVDERQQQMLERRVLVMPLVGMLESAMQGLLEALREGWHWRPTPFP